MSSRIRILYFGEYTMGWHIGLAALKALEKSYKDHASTKSFQTGEWRPADTANYKDATNPSLSVRIHDGIATHMVPVVIEAKPAPPIPSNLKGLARAAWIWDNLPTPIKKRSHFEIVRESRSKAWHKQSTNPFLHGGGKKSKKKKTVAQTVGQLIDAGLGRQREQQREARVSWPESPRYSRPPAPTSARVSEERQPAPRIGIWA